MNITFELYPLSPLSFLRPNHDVIYCFRLVHALTNFSRKNVSVGRWRRTPVTVEVLAAARAVVPAPSEKDRVLCS
ncbi:hypothetical protein PsorP6_002769 [Peronosclerospora sorghi]|uniref:Uncharacterized protein n=1 Tax=Peronosclerospora sorghi TaxID=230839 RepID=A0ACC0VKV3_9STRA|nr:hypothetical protein PsorP6_002769 [Peronosclerospora sorghi]